MDALTISHGMIPSLVIAVSFAAGLNVYATVFALGLMARWHWVDLPVGLESLARTWVIEASGVLFGVEFFADKIPAFDLVWNALQTFVRIPVAALLAYQAGSHLTPGMQAVVTLLGTGIAAIAHGSKTAIRVAVTPSPEPVSNISLSTIEDALAVALSWAAMRHPLVAGGVAVGLSVTAVAAVWASVKLVKLGLRRLQPWARGALGMERQPGA